MPILLNHKFSPKGPLKSPRKKRPSMPTIAWKRDPVGRIALVMIWLVGEHIAGTDGRAQTISDLSENGVTQENLCEMVTKLFPNMEAYFLGKFGAGLSPNKIYQRLDKMFYDNDNKNKLGDRRLRGGPGKEHPRTHVNLKLLIPVVERWFRDNRVITVQMAVETVAKIYPPKTKSTLGM